MKVRTHVIARIAVAAGAVATLVTAPSPASHVTAATKIVSASRTVDDLQLTHQLQQRASRDRIRAALVTARRLEIRKRQIASERAEARRQAALSLIAARRAAHQRAVAMSSASTGGVPPVWQRVAQCESTGNWHDNTGNGYFGGLQITAGNATHYGYARPDTLSPMQQVSLGRLILRDQGVSAWPICGPRAGLQRGD